MAPSGFRPCCYTETATDLGFTTLAVNDHLVFLVPWLRWANGAGCRPGSNRRHDAGHYRLAASGPRPRPADQVADYARPAQSRRVACRPRPRLLATRLRGRRSRLPRAVGTTGGVRHDAPHFV